MDWRDIAAIVFFCTAVNHLGLIEAIERVIKHSLPVINCPKCLTCWSVMTYQLLTGSHLLPSLAISLLCSYLAIWLELLMYSIDTLYNIIYGIIESYKENSNGDSPKDE